MLAMGLDIGTTTLSAVVLDAGTGAVLESRTEPNDTEIVAEPWARLQDAGAICAVAERIVRELLEDHPGVKCIGLTGQMHGILYADEAGNAVSPLFTWQDGRGDLRMPSGERYAQALSAITGQNLATGYGAVTHYYNLINGLVPRGAAFAMTIMDYVGMRLVARREPLTHLSNAQSFGAPDWPELGRRIRTTAKTECLGETPAGIPVSVAIGDNQASFLGSVSSPDDSVLVNIGTGGQVSVAVEKAVHLDGIEARPYVDGGRLLVGFSLCAGRSYSLLERLFREIAVLAGAEDKRLYGAMNALAERELDDPLSVCTQFSGTRQHPAARGSIEGIGTGNFTAAHLVQGVLHGMVDELHRPFAAMRPHMKQQPATLVGSGNGIRLNPALRALLERAFGMALVMPVHREEAAYGAALFALTASGLCPSVADAQRIIRYQG